MSGHTEDFGSMAPHGDFFEYDSEFLNISPLDMRLGERAIYLTGTIEYDTVFEMARRVTNFRYYIGGDMGIEGNEMYADNDAMTLRSKRRVGKGAKRRAHAR
jgi:hypothetical protein